MKHWFFSVNKTLPSILLAKVAQMLYTVLWVELQVLADTVVFTDVCNTYVIVD